MLKETDRIYLASLVASFHSSGYEETSEGRYETYCTYIIDINGREFIIPGSIYGGQPTIGNEKLTPELLTKLDKHLITASKEVVTELENTIKKIEERIS